jgi:hypothetical protein
MGSRVYSGTSGAQWGAGSIAELPARNGEQGMVESLGRFPEGRSRAIAPTRCNDGSRVFHVKQDPANLTHDL